MILMEKGGSPFLLTIPELFWEKEEGIAEILYVEVA